MAAAAARANKYLGSDTSGVATLSGSQPLGPRRKEAYWWGGRAGGTAAAQTITVIDPPTAYQDGQRFNFLAVAASTSATTLKVNGWPLCRSARRAAAPPWRPPTSLPPARWWP